MAGNKTDTALVIQGATGRMGRACALAAHAQNIKLLAGIETPDHALIGKTLTISDAQDDINLPICADYSCLAGASHAVDFSTPAASLALAQAAQKTNTALVIGTTGFSASEEETLAKIAQKIPMVKSGNMSVGVTLLSALVERAASTLDDEWDIELIEMHHKHKKDAPSGTALLLGEAASRARKIKNAPVLDRNNTREKGTVGYAVARGGTLAGEHQVIFAGAGESLRLAHHAEDRAIFAQGAMRAALWLRDKKAGLYTMRDVLGF